MTKKRYTEADVLHALSKKYPSPAYAMVTGVRNATGAVARARYADAVVMSCFPSRGLDLHGFEVKVSIGDWRREVADPEKAEAVARFMDFWWVVAPKGIVPLEDVPPTWGLMELNGRGLRATKPAPRNGAPEVLTRGFLASLLRGATKTMVPAASVAQAVQERVDEARERIERRAISALPDLQRRYESLLKKVRDFEAASGVAVDRSWDLEESAEAVRLARRLGTDGVVGAVEGTIARLTAAADGLQRDLDALTQAIRGDQVEAR